jgi:hypothetical protein
MLKKIAVVGAGIFGSSIALELDKKGYKVELFEKESDIMLKATKNNHNRIHYGYHYPRSLETTRQSLDGLLSFVSNYGDSIVYGFKNYYAIAKEGSHVTVDYFKDFCNKARISIESSFPEDNILNKDMVSDSFLVEEPVYDWTKLQSIVKLKLSQSNVKLRLLTNYINCDEKFDFTVNCAYSNINEISKFHKVEQILFKKQDIIIPIFKSNINRIGLTVMDGPFCSVMPKGIEPNKFLLYHAKYSVAEESVNSKLKLDTNLNDRVNLILEKSKIFYPFLKDVEVIDNWRCERAIPITDNDARVSEIITYKNNPNFITVFSGKVTTAVKIAKQVSEGIKSGNFNSQIYL